VFISEFSLLISAAMLWLSSQHQMLAGGRTKPHSGRKRQEPGYLGLAADQLRVEPRNRRLCERDQRQPRRSRSPSSSIPNDTSYTIEVFRTGVVWRPCRKTGNATGNSIRHSRSLFRRLIQPLDSRECNWLGGYTLTVSNTADPTDWVSGIYLAKLTGSSGNQSYIIFVVRDDSRPSRLLTIYQSTETTFQAYNAWGW